MKNNNGLTKRHLGLLLIVLGLGMIGGPLLIDLLGVGAFNGSGPLQRNLLLAGLALVVVGLTLLPLGNRPA